MSILTRAECKRARLHLNDAAKPAPSLQEVDAMLNTIDALRGHLEWALEHNDAICCENYREIAGWEHAPNCPYAAARGALE